MLWSQTQEDHNRKVGGDAMTNTYKMTYYCSNCGNNFIMEIPKKRFAYAQTCPLCECIGATAQSSPDRKTSVDLIGE